MRNVRIASAQADFFFLFREKRHQHFTKHLRLKLTTHERNGAAVQLFHGAVAFGDDIFAHEKLVHAVDFDDYESLQYFQRVLIHTGVIDALREAGIQEGDTVSMYDLEFDFVN